MNIEEEGQAERESAGPPLPPATDVEARWQAAWRDEGVFDTPSTENGHRSVQVSAGDSLLIGPLTLDQARRYVIADAHARFLRMRGSAVLFSSGLHAGGQGDSSPDLAATEQRAQLESLGLSIDWSRSFDSADGTFSHWCQQAFLTLLEAGLVHQGASPMLWCGGCRTLLPARDGGGDLCNRCQEPVTRLAAGNWYLRLELDATEDGSPDPTSLLRSLQDTPSIDLLGRTDGVEFDTKAIDGTTLTLFTPHSKQIGEAEFIAVSPNHPQIEQLVHDPELKKRIEAYRSAAFAPGGSGSAASISDTGIWMHIPERDEPLPLIVSLAVDARFGTTAVLGIPSLDPYDKQLSKGLPPVPSLRWGAGNDSLEVRPAARFRANSLPLSSSEGRSGIPVPAVSCASCGVTPMGLDALPLAEEPNAACPGCGEPAPRDQHELDPRVAAWAEMLIAIPPEDRTGARLDHPELRRWMPAMRALHGVDSSGAMFCNAALLKELRRRGGAGPASDEETESRTLIVGPFDAGDTAAESDAGEPVALADRLGADTLRFALLHAASPPKRFRVEELDAVLHSSREFLQRFWAFAEPRLNGGEEKADLSSIDVSDRLRGRLAKWCETALWKITENYSSLQAHRVTRNAEALLARLEDFERRAQEANGELSAEDVSAVRSGVSLLVLLISPITPHICEELWTRGGNEGLAAQAPWPNSLSPA